MTLVFDQVTFTGRAPDLGLVADKITALCGLAVVIERSSSEGMENLHDQYAHFAFACAAQEQLEIYTYRPGAVRQFYDDFTDGVSMPTERFVSGLNEPAGTQVVYLRGYLGLETLMGVTLLALEALGGQPRERIDDETRREYGRPITEAELHERRRQLKRQLRIGCWLQLLLLPITVPLFLVGLLWRLVTLPWRLYQAWRLTQDALRKSDHDTLLRSLPDLLEFVDADVDDYDELDESALEEYTRALEALGFVHALDYSVRFPGNTKMSKRQQGFARLWIHPTHHCYAEVNQAFSSKQKPTPMRCMIASFLEGDWSLSTTDRPLKPIYYAWRRPRSLWTRHVHMTPARLLAEHLRRRKRMLDALGIAIAADLTVGAYYAHSRKENDARKEVLRGKGIDAIRAEMKQCERHPVQEWAGELPAGCW
jgi:hypothetical protein